MNHLSPTILARRLAFFCAPYLVLALALGAFVIRTGELLSIPAIVSLDKYELPFLYLPEFSDRNFQYKRQMTKARQPEVIAIGSSRMNQWRSGMFKPYRFYNAAGCLYTQQDYRRFLESLGENTPKIVIFSLDFFTFDPQIDDIFQYRDYGDQAETKEAYLSILKDVVKATHKDPMLQLQFLEPLYGLPAVGLAALRTGTGFRKDGSYQYGGIIRNDPRTSPQSPLQFVARVQKGIPPFLKSRGLANSKKEEFTKFVAYAKSKGITLIGVTMPWAPELVEAVEQSDSHNIWREFRSSATKQFIRELGVLYFDFTELKAFSGDSSEFIDAMHPSEPALIRMLQIMLGDPQVRAVLPLVSPENLQIQLNNSTRLESYLNAF